MQDFCTWNVRGLNIPLDLEDAETSKNYQQAAELLKAFGTQEQLSNEAERIRADCAVIRSFFAAVLGETNTDSLFREIPDNRRMYLDIFEEFLAFVYRQTLAAAQRMTTIIQQYAPRDSNESAV